MPPSALHLPWSKSPDGPALDGWTLVHVGAGAALGALRLGWLPTLAALVAFEVFEAHQRSAAHPLGGALAAPESAVNIAVDIGVGLAGWVVARAVRR